MDILLAGNGESAREKVMKETKSPKVILPEEAVRRLYIQYICMWEMMDTVVKEKERLKNEKK